jgi:adenine-specific DNA-methyltransferase
VNENSSPSFSPQTKEWMTRANLKDRQSQGQYMTPRFLRSYLLEQLQMMPGDRVLDPAVGTGEFLRQALDMFPGVEVTGWDIDPEVLTYAKSLVPEARLHERSGLEEYRGESFDWVIGNPPYFELRLAEPTKSRFREVVSGRPNIYGLFFKVGLDALKEGGTLAYVVPPSMNSGAYFKNLRDYLTSKNHVVSLRVFNDSGLFEDAQTSVQVILIRKGPGKSNHTFVVEGRETGARSLIFCENPTEFEKLYEGSVSLSALGYEAVTGTTVWNQHKAKLTNSPDESCVPLIYARNLGVNGIELSEDDRRPQYIQDGRYFVGPAILVNRIIGGVGKGQIKGCLIEKDFKFAAENHLNVIRPIAGLPQKVDLEELFKMVTAPDVVLKARTLTGNTQLSATEWTHLIPLKMLT